MSEIKPALSAEEWALFLDGLRSPVGWIEGGCVWDRGRDADTLDEDSRKSEAAHGAAAMLLHGQPYGFTREDVELLRDEIGAEWDRIDTREEWNALAARFTSLADRIEALLPPE